ncbi:MAG: DUF3108 domain-containing protein [Pyrinomonadaceae bacterium]
MAVSKQLRRINGFAIAGFLLLFLVGLSLIMGLNASAQSVETATTTTSSIFRIGEKLRYSISFGKIPDAGFAETNVISRGKINGKDAVELRGRVKTTDIVSAAFFLLDESRTTFAAPDTGIPLYSTTSSLDSVTPKDIIRNYIKQPTSNFDLLTLIYKARESSGIGSFPLFEGEQMYTVSLQGSTVEKVKTEAGEFDTTVTTVTSDFLGANGIKDLKINFSTDEFRVPVLFRFKTAKGEFRAALAVISLPEPDPSPTPTPSPSASPSVDPGKKPVATPKPTATPIPYVDNLPLMPDLGFELGEVLDYRVTTGGRLLGTLSFNARERKLYNKQDSLLLTATVTAVEQGNPVLKLGDSAWVQVDPDTLSPFHSESKIMSPFVGLNQVLDFDRKTGAVSFGGKQAIDAPIGTQSFLSLMYAIRSFNLKPSKDLSNPVNDTRVAVFWDSRSYVFTLRPSNPEEITINGERVSAQLIRINTLNKELDALNLKVWLRTEDRVPVRITAGAYQADLLVATKNLF